MQNQSFIIIYILLMIILSLVGFYTYIFRKKLDEMHGMMVGMTFGMFAGLITSTLYLIPTGNFLNGVIIGSIVGLLFGFPFGKIGGHLGIMEGIIAGPMGGMMGAMLGQMVRPFNIELFIPFFIFIFLITISGILYAVNCGNCCNSIKKVKILERKIPKKILIVSLIVSILILIISINLSFSNDIKSNYDDGLKLPKYLQEIAKKESKEASIKGDYQEIDLKITGLGYKPNIILAKKGIPLKINIYAETNAGCGGEILFPDFNIDELIPFGGSKLIIINPDKEGTFKFRCSMDMLRGNLIIQ